MNPGQKGTPGSGTPGATNDSATTPTRPHSSRTRPSSKTTQYDRILSVLMSHDEVCGHRTFYGEMAIPRFSVHIHTARRNGIVISKRPCDWHSHEGTAYLYRIEALPTLPGLGDA